MANYTLLQEQTIRFADLIVLSYAMLKTVNETYGVYESEFCFNSLLSKIKESIRSQLVKGPRNRNLANYKEFENKCHFLLKRQEAFEL